MLFNQLAWIMNNQIIFFPRNNNPALYHPHSKLQTWASALL